MILTKTIIINVLKQKDYYKEKGYDVSKKQIEIKIEDLSKNSHKKVLVKCDVCGKEKQTIYQSYNSSIKNKNYYACCQKCSREKSKQTKLMHYNDENYNNMIQTELTKSKRYKNKNYNNSQKIKKVYLEKPIMEKEKIKDKIKETNLKKYGETSYSKTNNFKKKSKSSCFEKYGTEYSCQNKIIKDKATKTLKKTLKVKIIDLYQNYNIVDIDFENKKYILKCDDNHIYKINYPLFYYRKSENIPLCTVCNPVDSHISGKELQLIKFIKKIYPDDVVVSDRIVLNGKEIDIYLPKLKLAFEFNGLYWHSNRKKDYYYHYNKTKACLNKDIKLFHIWEDEFNLNINLIYNKIRDIINGCYQLRERQIKTYFVVNNNRIYIENDIFYREFFETPNNCHIIFDDGFEHIKI